MEKQWLKITRCDLSEDRDKLTASSDSFTVQINPAELSHHRAIKYMKEKTPGATGGQAKFHNFGNESLGFSVTFDSTGAVPAPSGNSAAVSAQIESLLRVVYKYQGEEHEPGYAQVLWGNLLFYGRLESLDTKYTLFAPNGLPLRAKVDLKFTGFVPEKEAALQAGMSSPDLSHEVTVKAGDTLPLLCKRIYGDGRYYPAVAKFNGLSRFRSLDPGSVLHFPPLV